jgi:hypothetical protein
MHPNVMPAFSRRVSANWDGLLASLQDAAISGLIPVVSLALNHRLIAGMPPASEPSL